MMILLGKSENVSLLCNLLTFQLPFCIVAALETTDHLSVSAVISKNIQCLWLGKLLSAEIAKISKSSIFNYQYGEATILDT